MSRKSRNRAIQKIDTPGTVRDELYLANGVAYIEGDLKLSHLRILITIIAHLQRPIRHRLLPSVGPITSSGRSRTLTIPLSAFSLGYNNSSKLRSLLTELQEIPIIFPPSRTHSALQQRFQGLIADYSFPTYARSVQIHLPEDLTWRFLLTDDGYTTFSQKEAVTLTNKYTVRLYWLICAWRNRGGFVMRLSELRRILCLSHAYSRLDNLIARVLAPAESELESRFPIWFHYRFYTLPSTSSIANDSSPNTNTPLFSDNSQNNYRNDANGYSQNSLNSNGTDLNRMIVFKIHLRVSEEQRSRDMAAAWDYCFNLMASIGARQDTLRNLFARLDHEDLRPFMEKLSETVTYIRTHSATIQSPDRYILSVMDAWFASWLERYK